MSRFRPSPHVPIGDPRLWYRGQRCSVQKLRPEINESISWPLPLRVERAFSDLTIIDVVVKSIEADYLVVGAGAAGMGFVDTLIAHQQQVSVILVDRRHRPGGHWLDAYPFLRLHNPSAVYGVASRRLGNDQIDVSGPNAGFYERASADAVCDYYAKVLDDHFAPTGQVRFLGMHVYEGEDADGHHIVSRISGARTLVKVRRRHVDATYVASEIPARRRPLYGVDPGVRVVAPNALVELDVAPSGVTIIGAGKTAMDTCCWLIDAGIDPDRIRWIRPSDPWVFDRASIQPLDLVASQMHMQACWVEAIAHAEDGVDFARRLESGKVFMRIDPEVEPTAWRGAIISRLELAALRSVQRVERGRVIGVGTDRIKMNTGEVPTASGEVHIDCTAAGVPTSRPKPIFEPGRLTIQYISVGSAPLGAATLGVVEALSDDDGAKNRMCPPLTYSGKVADLLGLAHTGLVGAVARSARPEIATWHDHCRLNHTSAARDHRDEPDVIDARAVIASNIAAALSRSPMTLEQ